MSTNTATFQLPKRSFNTEFWVGIFALLGVGAFAYLAINIAGIRVSNAGFYEIYAEFNNVSGLKVGAPVEIAGVEIGEVTGIILKKEDPTIARIAMRVQDAIKLRDDDIAAVRTKGIIGDRYIKVVPGGSEKLVPTGATLTETESAMEFEEVIGKFIHRFDS